MTKIVTNVRQKSSAEAIQWLKHKIEELRNSEIRTQPKLRRGYLYFFFYDPKMKSELPYYDTFPLTLVLDIHHDGITALNFHYVPPKMRMVFLDKLSNFASEGQDGEINRMRISYEILVASRRLKEFRPCLKRYLYTHIRSRVLPVQPGEWTLSVALPIAQFKKRTQRTVWEHSTDQIKSWKPNTGIVHVAGNHREEE